MNNFVIDFVIKLLLTVASGLALFFMVGMKKFVEKACEMMAEDWYKKRKG